VAFIPKNALPYLKYLKDPDYCHLYYADLAPYVFDASIGSGTTDQSNMTRTQASWRTVLIGGMRTGGACANTCTAGSDCVKTPATDKGFSSYFALDVTDPTTPSLMWEFTNPGLGFTTTGPAVIRINAVNTSTSSRDRDLNGEWYVVFGSGPTGPIDNTNNQFLGRSNQDLKFFVLNLKTGALAQTIDTTTGGTITNAFAGSMINSVADFNLDYQDDAIYVGYVKKGGERNIRHMDRRGRGKNPDREHDADQRKRRQLEVEPRDRRNRSGHLRGGQAPEHQLRHELAVFRNGRYFFENPPTGTNTTPEIGRRDGAAEALRIEGSLLTSATSSALPARHRSPSRRPILPSRTSLPSPASPRRTPRIPRASRVVHRSGPFGELLVR